MDEDVEYICRYLPDILPLGLFDIVSRYLSIYPDMSEIRIRRGSCLSFTVGDRNVETVYICDQEMIESCLTLWVGDSKYKYSDSILRGVIPLTHGFRVGIAGKALIVDGSVRNVYDLSSFAIRLPRCYKGCSSVIYEYINGLPRYERSMLIVSPPCGGKTTVIRDLIHKLSTPPVAERVCVVDTRCELGIFDGVFNTHVDVFSGYPIEIGIEIATRYFNPQYIVCDEIGGEREICPILNAANAGVPLIATAHSPSLSGLVLKNNIRILFESNVFCNVAVLKLLDKTLQVDFYDSDDIKDVLRS